MTMTTKDDALRVERALKLARDYLLSKQMGVHIIAAIREALAEQPAISAGPITPAMMQGPTPEQKAQMVEAMSKLAEQPAQVDPCIDGSCSCCWTHLDEQPAQQQEPVAYDKTELNCFAQDLYDKKMREGKHGHYESMFHVIHQCIKKVAPPASKPLTDEEIKRIKPISADFVSFRAGVRCMEREYRIGEKR